MTFYCLPTENKLYIHLDGLPSIFLVAYEFRNVIWAAVSISRMYIFPPSFHDRLKLLFSSMNIHYSAVHGEIFMKPVRMERGRGRKDDAVIGEAFELDVFWSLNLLNVLQCALRD